MNSNKFILSKVSILTHIYTYGPPHKLLKYLLDKNIEEINFIGNPFSFAKDTRSFYKLYKHSNLEKESYLFNLKIPDILLYVKDFIYSLYWGSRMNKVEVLICFDGLSTFAGYIIKIFRKTRYLIFYTIDYAPERFKNNFLNKVYLWIDTFAMKKADIIWNVSEEMSAIREKSGIKSNYFEKQITVPIGVEDIFLPRKLNKINRYKIAFIGHLKERQGLEKLISAMPSVLRKLPNTSLTIIGGGPLENDLKLLVKQLNLEKKIKFTGYLEDYEDALNILRDCAIGVAPYEDDPITYTRFADPTKPKDYLACGLPVVITKVPAIYKYIEEKNCGIAINDNKKELIDAIVYLLDDKKRLKFFRNNTYGAIKEFENKKVYDQAFQKVLDLFLTRNEIEDKHFWGIITRNIKINERKDNIFFYWDDSGIV